MTTEQRLENLEKELARVKRRSRWLLAMVLLGVGLVVLAAAWMGTAEKAVAGNAAKAPTIIRANAFIVEDENGKIRAALSGVEKDGHGLFIYDDQLISRAGLINTKDGPRLVLGDENHKTRAGLGVTKDGPSLLLSDENDKVRAGLGVTKNGPQLELGDGNAPRARLGAGIITLQDGTKIMPPESTILLFNKDGKVIWQVP
jgi:hypothetical protein